MPQEAIQQYITDWVNGDDMAFRHIFNHYYPRLVPVSLKWVKQREDSEELVMNVFLNIWQFRQRLEHVDNFEKYIFKILRNQAADLMRKNIWSFEQLDKSALEQLSIPEGGELSFRQMERIYQMAIDRLPEKRREVFLMSREQGMSHQEIADRNNISVNTVNNHIKAAMKIIRNDMGEYADALPLLLLVATAVN
jgi:RNA polymerase sigma-70 factor (family 1)